ncbi:hypothetical protein OSB04_010208 [Centaurea solstitialis]|uniref:Uncharacterized protein n=1 Tax=Centaurea solstitialis TaxID=347529 RepID=A0AA38T8T0_9ASTR|nr:hypothetical protein OSB04_010208 [Centaurea solstitialis]
MPLISILATADQCRRTAPRLRVFWSPHSLTSDVCLLLILVTIDSCIKSWFYSICDAYLLQIISSDNCTAKDLWDKLDEFFLSNKMSRMLQLQEQFRNAKKGTSSITDFCHNQKKIGRCSG